MRVAARVRVGETCSSATPVCHAAAIRAATLAKIAAVAGLVTVKTTGRRMSGGRSKATTEPPADGRLRFLLMVENQVIFINCTSISEHQNLIGRGDPVCQQLHVAVLYKFAEALRPEPAGL